MATTGRNNTRTAAARRVKVAKPFVRPYTTVDVVIFTLQERELHVLLVKRKH